MSVLAYLLEPDMHLSGCWELGEISGASDRVPLPSYMFRQGRELALPQDLCISLSRPGREIPFTMAAVEVPVVGNAIAAVLRELESDVQLIPAVISRPVADSYSVVNTRRVVDAIDSSASKVTRWGPNDGRPDKEGSIRMVTRLVLDAHALRTAPQIFRLKGWVIPLIARAELGQRLRGFEGLDLIPIETA